MRKDKKEEKKKKKQPKNSQEYIEQVMTKRKKIVIISAIVVVLIVLAVFVSTIFAITAMGSKNIIKGITIENIDVSGMDKNKAYELLKGKMEERQKAVIKLKYGDYEKEIPMEQFEIEANIEETVDKALAKGRDNNIFVNNYTILNHKFKKENIEVDIKFNDEELERILTDTGLELPGVVKEYTYSVEDGELIITPGTDGIVIDKEKINSDIKNGITDLSEGFKTERTIDIKNEKAKAIDVEEIYKQIHSDPQNAYIVDDPFQIVVDKDGIDFGISIEEAKELVSQPKEEYVIPLKITKADVRVIDLGPRAFPDLLGSATTRYDAGNVDRTTNLAIACKKINGYVLAPGEVFSYNQVLGKRTSANGYKEAAVYVAGGVENGLGGGICQISSTLYNAVLIADLGIEERHNHSYTTSYIEAGKDATVSYGVLDFKFKNTREYPIKIEAYIKAGVATVNIYGIKGENENKIQIVASVTSTIPAPVEKIEDPSIPEGKEQIVTKGTNGCRSVTYKKVYSPSGELISNTQISADTYGTIKRVIKVGTKKAEAQPEPVVTPSPAEQVTQTQTQTPATTTSSSTPKETPEVTPSQTPKETPASATPATPEPTKTPEPEDV